MSATIAAPRKRKRPSNEERRAARRAANPPRETVSNEPFRLRLRELEAQQRRERATHAWTEDENAPPAVMQVICARLGGGFFSSGRADTSYLQRVLGLRSSGPGKVRKGVYGAPYQRPGTHGTARNVLDWIEWEDSGREPTTESARRGANVEWLIRRYPPTWRTEIAYDLAVRLCRALDMDPHECGV